MDELIETAELSAFARIVELGSLSKAARELGVPRATIGRRLARLEERLGARLVRRTTRELALTDEGRTLYEHARTALGAVREAALSVRRSDGAMRGRLRVSVPPLPGSSFHGFVRDFLARHPEVTIEIDFSAATVRLGGEGGYDLALRASDALEPGLVRRLIAQSRSVAVASPDYLARRGTPRSAKDLVGHACILDYSRGELPRREWPLRAGGTVRVDGPVATNHLPLIEDAALGGLGIALLPEMRAIDALERGVLVRVLEDEIGAAVQIAVVYTERHYLRPVVRAFADAMVAWGLRELPRMEAQCAERRRAEAQARRGVRATADA